MMKADQWGVADVDALLVSLDNDQINEWMAYDRTQHSALERQTAQICYTMASIWSGGSKRPKYEDFLPKRGPRRSQSAAEAKTVLQQFAGLFAGKK